jgi:uncharacterized protein YmfQ (DUF2313 family)
MANFQAHTVEEHQQALGQYLPNDRLFQAKNIKGKNLYKLLTGLSGEFQRVDAIFQSAWDGTNILTTQDVNYIQLWEGMVGIPNSYFTQTSELSINERRNQILIQLRSLGVLTEQDFIDLAALLDYTITITHGTTYAVFPLTFPLQFINRVNEARFVMVVNLSSSLLGFPFPLTFPAPFSSQNNLLTDLFNTLVPANTILIFNYVV